MSSRKFLKVSVPIFMFLIVHVSYAQVTWDGGAGTSSWGDALNWSTDVVPTAVEDVVINWYVVEIPNGVAAVAKTLSLLGGDLSISASGSLTVSTPFDIAIHIGNGGSIINDGSIDILNCSNGIFLFDDFSQFINNGIANISNYFGSGLGYVIGGSNCSVENNGSLAIDQGLHSSSSGIFYAPGTGHTFDNNGSITIGATTNLGRGISLFDPGNPFNNYGTISILSTGINESALYAGTLACTFNNHSTGFLQFGSGVGTDYINNSSLKLMNDGTIDLYRAGSINIALTGSGLFSGTEPFVNSGSIESGNGPASTGCITFENGLTHSGSTIFELSGSSSCTNNDKISAGSTANISGSATVQLIFGFLPTDGQTFTLMEAPSINGTFSSISYPNVSGITWTTAYNANSVVATAHSTLPVELTVFNAQPKNGVVRLNWSTASETNNKGFVVQRSTNSDDWENIRFVQGGGDQSMETNYELVDKTPLAGISYYRLQQIDFGGAYAYSKMVSVDLITVGHVAIFPNPNSGFFQVSGIDKFGVLVRISNTNGINVYQGVYDGQPIELKGLQSGLYFLELVSKGQSIFKRFIVSQL